MESLVAVGEREVWKFVAFDFVGVVVVVVTNRKCESWEDGDWKEDVAIPQESIALQPARAPVHGAATAHELCVSARLLVALVGLSGEA